MESISEYISSFPPETQKILKKIYSIIRHKAKNCEEGISYGMPAFKIHGKPLVYFAAFKNHIGFYATPTGHKKFEKQLSPYKQGKGSVQFQLNEPIPYDLIEEIVEFRIDENAPKR